MRHYYYFGLWTIMLFCFGLSGLAQDFNMSSAPVTTCTGVFYDNGGSGSNYSSSVNITKTFTSTSGERLRFAFQSFSTESCCDGLLIFDGPGTSSPFLGDFRGGNSPGIVVSTGNSITFQFFSDGFGTASGWAALISCLGPALTPFPMAQGTVNSCSGAFYDSGGPTGTYLANEDITQTFCSDNGQKIQFQFNNAQFDLASGDTLFAYDGNSVSGSLLGAFVTGSRVETLTSTGTCLTFRFKSNLTGQGAGWSGIFSCTATAPAANTFQMSSGIRGVCSGTFTDDGGLSGNYSSGQFRTQTFQSLNGERLRFTFQQFSTESCCDYLQIWDGPNTNAAFLGDFRGGSSPGIITSSGTTLTFRFGSDGTSTAAGFAATIECQGTALPVYNMSSGTTTTCSGVFYDAGGSLGNYASFENRTQTFCSGTTDKIQFTFVNTSFNLASGDTLFAYDGNSTTASLLGAYVTGSRVETLTSTGTCLTFRFKSDFNATVDKGWQALISCTATAPAANTYEMSSGIRGVCSGTFTDDGGLNGNYSSGQFRTQTFQSLNGERLRFTFQQFSTESCCDYLQVWDGPNTNAPFLGDFRGGSSPGIITSSGTTLTFRFGSDGTSTASGFAATIECQGTALPVYNMGSGTTTTCSGVFYDAGGITGNYASFENRTQTFCSGTSDRIQFSFLNTAFNLASGDTLFAYDGNSTSGSLLGAYVTGSRVETLTSTGTCLTFRFKSDFNATVDKGWQALISCTATAPAANVYQMSSGIRGVCSGTFTDDGGLNGNYSSSQFRTQTFQSLNGERLRFTFQQFSTESCCDYLQIWDGPNTNAPFLGDFRGGSSPGIITSSGTTLTFRFGSDGTSTASGFAATMECFGTALQVYNMGTGTVNTCSGAFYDAGGSTGNYGTFENRTQTFCSDNGQKIQFSFNNLAVNIRSGDSLWVYDGNVAGNNLLGIYVLGSRIETLTSSGTCLTFRFVSGNGNAAGWASVISCTSTLPALVYQMSSGVRVACSGTFTDNGGLNGNYSSALNQTQTFLSPDGERLRFVFQSFSSESGPDYLDIYDGPNSSFPFLGRLSGGQAAGLTFTSTGGALTFRFISDGSSTSAGWVASIQCAGPALTTYNMSSGTVNTCSGVFYDAAGGGTNYPNNENRIQTFCSDNGQRIVFDFTNFEVESQDTLFAYDGNSVSAPLLGAYVRSSAVEKVTSSGTCITFRFKSDQNATLPGWKAIISCSPDAPATVVYPMSTGIRGTCSGIFADNGGLTANYANNQNLIQTYQSRSGERLRFNFQQFSVEGSDLLRIYDGPSTNAPLIGIYTGTQGPGILQSTGSQLTFWFTSNSSGTGNFAASIECFGQALQEYPMSSGTVTTCSGVFTDNGGKLQNYPILENRVQTFCASGSQKMKFVFNPLAFKLSSNDTLWVYDGNSTSAPLLGYYLEGSFVEDLTSSGTCLTFRFKSDLSTSTVDQGWSAVLSCTSEIPGNLVYPMSTGLRVVCSGIFTDNGNLTGNYSNSANQIQTFQSPNNTRLEFSFSQFQTQSASDLLIVYDGPGIGYPEIGRYYLSINPGTIRSTGNSLTFWFISNSTSSAPGWAASFTCAGPALPEYNMTNGTVNACEGRWFDDGGATGVYGNNRNLIQTFCSPTGQRMMFTFSRFVTNLFPSDTLFAYDGNSITAPLIGAYALQGEFEPVVSSGSCITFRFKSDASLNAAGWAAVFACTDNPPQPPVYKHRSGIRVACSGFFTDNGGPADNYSYLGPTTTYTFQSETAGARLQFNFSQFSTRLNLDILRVYDGPSAASSLLGSFSGFNSPGILTSTGSTLTFVFTHPSTTASAPGWVASIQCLANVPLVGTLPAGPYCAGATVSVPFTSPDQIDGNVFSAQLSDASGQFSNPTTVGTLTGTSSGTISVLLPSGLSSSGLYRLRILGSSPALAGSPSSPFTVLAIPTQPGAIAGPDNLCAGAGNAQYNVGLVSGALSYTWSVPAGASIVSGQGTNAIVVQWGSTSGQVSVVASNSCGNAPAQSRTITINSGSAPIASVSTNAVNNQVCEGSTVLFSANVTAGPAPALQWLVNGVDYPGATGTQLVLPNLLSAVTVTLRVTATSGCFSPAVLVSNPVSVSVIPNQPVSVSITNSVSNAAICAGQPVQFNAALSNGGTAPQYSWQINGQGFPNNTGASFSSSTLQNGDQVRLVLTSNATCAQPVPAVSNTISMVVNPVLPVSVTISSNTGGGQVCGNNQLLLSANVVNGGDAPAYVWNLNGSPIPGETGPSLLTPIGLTGTQNYSVRITSNAVCPNPLAVTSAVFPVSGVSSIVPAISAVASVGSGPVCLGTPITFTATPVNGGGSPGYQWRINGNPVTGQTAAQFTTSTLAVNDQVDVVLTSSDPCASPVTATSAVVSVNLVSSLSPAVTVSGSVPGNTICAGTTVVFTASPVNGGASPQYQWSVNGVDVSGETSSSFSTSGLANGAQVRVKLTSSFSCASPASVTSVPLVMTVNPLVTPTVGISSSLGQTFCTGANSVLSSNITNGGTNPTFQWYLNNNPIPNATAPTYTTPGTLTGNPVYTVQLTSTAACLALPVVVSAPLAITLQPGVVPSVVATSNVSGNTICSGQTVTFTADPTNGGSAPGYQWLINNQIVPNQTSVSFTTNALANGDNVAVRMTSNASCANPSQITSVAQTMVVTPGAPAAVSVSSDAPSNTVCTGQAILFTASPVNGGSAPAYQWTLNNTDIPGANQGTYQTSALSNGDQIRVRMTSNSSCANPSQAVSSPVSVVVNPNVTPQVSLSHLPVGVSFCAGTSVQITANPTNGGTNPVFQWRVNGNLISGVTGPVYDLVLNQASTVTATLISNAPCASPSNQVSTGLVLGVTPGPVLNLSEDTTVCEATAAFFLQASPAGGTWSGNGISQSGLFTPGSVGTYIVRYTYQDPGSGCIGRDSVEVQVLPRPSIAFGNTDPICTTAPPRQLQASPAGGIWSGPGVSATGLFNPANSGGPGQKVLTYQVEANGCQASKILVVSVTVPPAVDAGGPETVCFSTAEVQMTGLPAGGTWSGEGINGAGLFTPGFVTPGSTINLTYTVDVDGCEASQTKQVTVSLNPATVNAGPDLTVCASDPAFVLTGFVGSGGTWTGTGVSGNGIFNPSQATLGPNSLTYTVTFIQSPACSGTDTRIINVLAAPQAPLTIGDTVCRQGVASLQATGVASQYRWYTTATGGVAIAGQISPLYQTPVLQATTQFFVAQVVGTCESPRAGVTALVNDFNSASFSQSAGTLTASPSNGQSYFWFLNGSLVASTPSPTYQAQISGDYAVSILLDGCLDTSAVQFVQVVGIRDAAQEEIWTLAPNPASGQVILKGQDWTEMRIRTILGQELLRLESSHLEETRIDLGSVSNGIYEVEVRGPGRLKRFRLVIRK